MYGYFEQALNTTLINEGGYSNDPDDRGGLTRYGISQKAYPDLDIATLTLVQARKIYRRDYWQRPGFDRIKSKPLALLLFDIGVNTGTARVVIFLQSAANRLGAGLNVDGLAGPATRKFIHTYPHPAALIMAFKIEAGNYYIGLEQPKFLAGWLNRLAA